MRYRKIYSSVFFCLFLLHAVTIQGQKGTGKLAGKITDAANNQTLNAANIIAAKISRGTRSITDGTYILSLPPGKYTISFSYTGYQKKDIQDVEIKAGETTYLDIVLDRASQNMEEVVVTTTIKREAQSAIYNRQKLSAAASDGISIEAIRRTPDNNAGQIMKRITGVNVQDNRFVVVRGLGDQYNQTMLNGVLMTSTESNRNAFAMDLIPAAVLDNITVNKTATPDMPGNFAGGIVQINTKDFPANDFYSVAIGAGFSDQTLGKDFYSGKKTNLQVLGFGANTLNLPSEFPTVSKKTGALGNLNGQEQQRFLRMLNNNLAPVNHGPSKPNFGFQLGYGKTIKFKNESQFGIVLALNHRKTELIEQEILARDPNFGLGGTSSAPEILGLNYYFQSTRYRYNADFGGVLNLAYRFGNNKITFKNLITQIYNNAYTDRPNAKVALNVIPNPNITPAEYIGITHFVEQKGIINSILSGEHRTGKDNDTRIDWNLNTTVNRTNTPDLRNFLLEVLDSAGNLSIDNQTSDPEKAFRQQGRVWTKDRDIVYGGSFNITSPFVLANKKQIFKAGMLFQNRKRETEAVVVIYQGLKGKLDSLLAPGSFYPGGGSLSDLSNISEGTGTFNSGSSLLAAYASVENKIGKALRIIWGIRAENYQQYVNIYTPVFYPNFRNFDLDIQGVTARTTFNFLPSINIIYAVNKKMNIRAAYSKTVARPELKDLAEFPRYDYFNFFISQGNSGLRTTSIQNMDIKFEVFPSAGEIISAGLFYKKLKNPIEYARFNLDESYLIPFNVGDAYVKGAEIEIRKRIDFIPFAPWLKNVTIFGNGTLLNSKVSTQLLNDILVPKVEEHTLTGQPNYIVNAGLTIAAFKNTFEITGSYNRTGDYILQLGSSFRNQPLSNGENIFLTPFTRINPRDMVDITISQLLLKNKFRLKATVNNLLNSPFIAYQDVNNNAKLDEPIKLDLKVNDIGQLGYKSGVDNTTSSILAQRTYTFSITYTF